MKYLYQIMLSVLVVSKCASVNAQETPDYQWQMGLGIGYTNYYGDLSNYRINAFKDIYKAYKFAAYNQYYQRQPSFSVLLQKKLTPTLGVMIQANYMQFAMSDRYRKNNGTLDTIASNYSRSLNFRTTMKDVGIAFSFSPANGRIASEKTFFYPSFYIGAGVSSFTVKGDLYDSKNNQYNYRLAGNINDGTYETNLRNLRTETNSRYRNIDPYVDLGLALNFRINSIISIALQSDIKYSASDYLDDVRGQYKSNYSSPAEAYAAMPGYNIVDPVTFSRGDNNGVNDIYINNRIMFVIGLSKKKEPARFRSPLIYSLQTTPLIRRQVLVDSSKRVIADSVNRVSGLPDTSATSLLKDSVKLAELAFSLNKRYPINQYVQNDTNVYKRLDTISTELKYIKRMLREQQILPRLNQLRFQRDSVLNLRNRLLLQRASSKENYLRLQIFNLQLDSLQNEYEKSRERDSVITGSVYDRSYFSVPANTKSFPEKPAAWVESEDSAEIRQLALQKINLLQRKLDSLEDVQNISERESVSLEKIVNDKVADSLATIERDEIVKKQLEKNADSINVLKQRLVALQESSDNYKNDYANQREIISVDTVQKKRSAFRRFFSFKKSKNVPAKTHDSASLGKSTGDSYYRASVAATTEKIDSFQRESDVLTDEVLLKASIKNPTDSSKLSEALKSRIAIIRDSIRSTQQLLQRSTDSAAYYKMLLEANTESTRNLKWYQNLFTTEVQRERRRNEENELRSRNEAQFNNNNYEVQRMQSRIQDLETRNTNLADAYQSLGAGGYRRDQTAPVVVNSGGNDRASDRRDIDDIRAQLANLQKELNYDARGVYLRDTVSKKVTTDTAVTIVAAPPVSIPATMNKDSSQANLFKTELSQIKKQLDSLINNRPAAKTEKPIVKDSFDVSGFPVISVYFKMGASVLTADQLNKITPFAQVASKNKTASITLKGFTDPVGNASKNKIIAEKRSQYIKSYLMNKYRISAERIVVQQPDEPVKGSGKKPNPLDRRVDMQFL